MSKEVTVTPICPHHEERVVATIEHTIVLDDSKPVLIDMCDDCDMIYGAALLVFIEDGTPVEPSNGKRRGRKPKPTTEDDLSCPICGRSGYATRQGRNKHMRDEHNQSIRDYEREDTVGHTD